MKSKVAKMMLQSYDRRSFSEDSKIFIPTARRFDITSSLKRENETYFIKPVGLNMNKANKELLVEESKSEKYTDHTVSIHYSEGDGTPIKNQKS